jgi:hypothetical protein
VWAQFVVRHARQMPDSERTLGYLRLDVRTLTVTVRDQMLCDATNQAEPTNGSRSRNARVTVGRRSLLGDARIGTGMSLTGFRKHGEFRVIQIRPGDYFAIASTPLYRASRRRRVRAASRQGMILAIGAAVLDCIWPVAFHVDAARLILALNVTLPRASVLRRSPA